MEYRQSNGHIYRELSEFVHSAAQEARRGCPLSDMGSSGQTDNNADLEWVPGDVIMDLYEVLPVICGSGPDAVEAPYHQGGFGRVYRVWHRNWHREMGVKVPRAGKYATAQQKRDFIRECETWVNLGLHPHVATCYYVRELGGVPRVFCEYADTGTLSDWIHSGRLYNGGSKRALARMLDLAIQLARGLHFSHEQGVVHQDVKPLNALMWDDGTLKVADFGLARARQKLGPEEGAASNTMEARSLDVSCGGMTPAYCSPEQLEKKKLSRASDIWSWAVTVLEMFKGEVTWSSGALAGQALEAWLDRGLRADEGGESIPALPAALVPLLFRCFALSPQERPGTLQDCADILARVYSREMGEAYPRPDYRVVDDSADILNNRALSLLDLGRPRDAKELFENALELDPQHVNTTYNRDILRRQGIIEGPGDADALFRLREIRKNRSGDPGLECALGWLLLEHGDFLAARRHFEEALVLKEWVEARRGLELAVPGAKAAAGQRPEVLHGHADRIAAVAWVSEGSQLLSGSDDRTLRLWDLATGQCLRVLQGHADWVCAVDCYPTDYRGISGGCDRTLRQWDLATGRCLVALTGHQHWVTSASYVPGGRLALSGSYDCTLRLWDLERGSCLRVLEGHTAAVKSVVCTPRCFHALSGSADGTLRLWDLESGCSVQTMTGHAEAVTAVALDPVGGLAISASADCSLRLWKASTGQCLRILEGHDSGVAAVAFVPDGCRVVSASRDHTVRLWDLGTGRCLRVFEGHSSRAGAVACSPDGWQACSGGDDRTLRLWSFFSVPELRQRAPLLYSHPVSAGEAVQRDNHHQDYVARARLALEEGNIARALTAVQQALAVPGYARSANGLDLKAQAGKYARIQSFHGSWLQNTMSGHRERVTSVAFSPVPGRAVSGSFDRTVKLWDVATGACLFDLIGHEDAVTTAGFSPDGGHVLSGSRDRSLRLWNARTGDCVQILAGHTGPVVAAACSPRGDHAISSSFDGSLRVWELASGCCLEVLPAMPRGVKSLVYALDGNHLLSGGDDSSLYWWELGQALCPTAFTGHTQTVNAVDYDPVGQLALSGSDDQMVGLWNLERRTCMGLMSGHTNWVNAVAFSPDGHYALSGSEDKTLRLWKVSDGLCLRVLAGHTEAVTSVAFSPDSRYVLSGSGDNTLRLWQLDWKYHFPGWADEDEAVKPYLHQFLSLWGCRWGDEHFQLLLQELSRRGWGWLRPQAVRQHLREIVQEA